MRENFPRSCRLHTFLTVLCAASLAALFLLALPAAAQSYTVLHAFKAPPSYPFGSEGYNSYARLVQEIDGSFYGTTWAGGSSDYGTIFNLTSAGILTTLHEFTGFDGLAPFAGLVRGSNGDFYGTTVYGGTGYGNVFKMTPSGTLTTLYSFGGSDGQQPFADLVQGTDGSFYGTTSGGGANSLGTVFKITPSGTLTTLYSFAGSDGADPNTGLVQGTDGNFYGTTNRGGANSLGSVFMITPSGALAPLHSFAGPPADGQYSWAGLVQGRDGNFYGTTNRGGANGIGTVFKITPSGTLTTLHSFSGRDGEDPHGTLVQGTDGNFYGTTIGGGANGLGTVFRITPAGTLTTLYSFAGSDGQNPWSGLVQGSNGSLYGTTVSGGPFDGGVVFRLTPPATATVSGGGTICAGGSATIQAALAGTPPWVVTWSDGVTQASLSAGPATRIVSPSSSTTYTVTAVSDANGPGTVSGSAVVTVEKAPKAEVSGDATICAGSSTVIQAALTGTAPWSLVWSDGFAQTVSSSPATRTVSPSTHTVYGVTSISDAGCSGSSSGNANVKVDPIPSAVITAPVSVCANSAGNGASVPNAGGGATYSWSIANGTITSGAGTKKITFTAGSSGAVSLGVTVTSPAGCTSSGSLSAPITAVPNGTIAAPPSVCANKSGYLASVPDAGLGATYAWAVSKGTITAGAGTPTITFSSGGSGPVTIKVTITNGAGCTTVTTAAVPVVGGC